MYQLSVTRKTANPYDKESQPVLWMNYEQKAAPSASVATVVMKRFLDKFGWTTRIGKALTAGDGSDLTANQCRDILRHPAAEQLPVEARKVLQFATDGGYSIKISQWGISAAQLAAE